MEIRIPARMVGGPIDGITFDLRAAGRAPTADKLRDMARRRGLPSGSRGRYYLADRVDDEGREILQWRADG